MKRFGMLGFMMGIVGMLGSLGAAVFHGVAFLGDTAYVAVMEDSTLNVLFTPNAGLTWENRSAYANNTLQPMWDVEFVNGSVGWIGGIVSFLFHTQDAGYSWSLQNYGGSKFITRIKMLDAQTGWAAGGDAIYFRTTDGGQTWTWYLVSFDVVTDLYGVAAISADECYMAGGIPYGAPGGQGYVFHTTDGGQTWQILLQSDVHDFLDVAFPSPDHGVVVGGTDTDPYEPVILYTQNGGQTWTDVTPAEGHTLRAVHFVDENEGWAVGKFGTVLHTTDGGLTWSLQNTPTQVTLFDVEFSDALHGMAVGDSNVVLYTADGGQSWVRYDVVQVEESQVWIPGRWGVDRTWIVSGRNLQVPEWVQRISENWTVLSVQGREIGRLRQGNAAVFMRLPEGAYWLRSPHGWVRVLKIGQ